MALTPTATLSTRKCVATKKVMYAKPCYSVYSHQFKTTKYFVSDKPKEGIWAAFQPIAEGLLRERDMGRVIVVPIQNHSENLVLNLRDHLNYVKYRVLDLYSYCTHSSVKNKLLNQFTSSSALHLIIATKFFLDGDKQN